MCLVLAAAQIATAWAQAPDSAKPVVHSQIRQAEATVQTVDPATREVTLRGPKGPFSVVAGPEVRNLDKVQAGDKVTVSYYEGIAAQMAKGAVEATEPAAATFGSSAMPGERPGGLRGASVTSRVIIEDVDPGTNTVAFRRPDGTVHIIAVKSPQMQKFIHTLKRGDAVDVTYTESVAVKVVPSRG